MSADRGSKRVLHAVGGAAALGACWAAGSLAAPLLPLPIPGSLVGMALAALLVRRGWLPEAWARPAAGWLIRWMALFFVPAGVGLMAEPSLRSGWQPVVAGGAASTLAVLLVVGWLHQRLGHD